MKYLINPSKDFIKYAFEKRNKSIYIYKTHGK